MPRLLPLAVLLLGLLGLLSCGGAGGAAGMSAQLPEPPLAAGLSDQLPSIPAPVEVNMARISAAVDAGTFGALFDQSGGAEVLTDGTRAVLNSATNQPSWVLYSFGGVPGESISAVNYEVSSLDDSEEVYAAIGDYASGRWRFLPLTAGSNVSLPLGPVPAGTFQSGLGNSSLLIVAWGGDSFAVERVSLTYEQRYAVSGSVVDKTGSPVPDVVVSTPVGGIATLTDAAGNFTLSGLPDGDWPLLATRNGWTFYPQPTFVTVSGADTSVGQILGDPHGARFTSRDALPGNDDFTTAPLWDFVADGPLLESASADDDRVDLYRFQISTPGNYVLHFKNADRKLLAPQFAIFTPEIGGVYYAEEIYRGEVSIPLSIAQAPSDLRFLIQAIGGGGEYEVSLNSDPIGRLGLYATVGGNPRSRVMFEVTPQATGFTTEYFSSSPITGGVVSAYDRAYPLGMVDVVPKLPGYSFMPPNVALDVTASGAVASQAFLGTPPVAADNYEPNNSTGTAHAIAALPYTSPVPLSVTADSVGDYIDYYSFTPPAGSGIRAKISYGAVPTQFSQQTGLVAQLRDNSGNVVASQYGGGMSFLPDGVLVESLEPADGSPYFLSVSANFNYDSPDLEAIPYVLEVSSYAGVSLKLGARVANSYLTDGARFVVYDEAFGLRRELTNNQPDLLTQPLIVPVGTKLRVEAYRRGCALDGQTKLIEVNADSVVYFDTPDLGNDSREPNSSYATANQLAFLPITINATFCALDDTADFYKLNPANSKPFRVKLQNADPGLLMAVTVYNHMGGYVGSWPLNGPNGSVLVPNNGMAGQAISISAANSLILNYEIEVSQADGYKLAGVVRDTGAVGLDAVVVNLTTGARTYASAGAGGAYEFSSPLEPGSYDIACYAVGYAPSFEQAVANVTNADVTRNFISFTAFAEDNYEPNNTAGTAAVIALDTDYSAAVNALSGDKDYYSVALNQGDQVLITLTPPNPWELLGLVMLDQYGTGSIENWGSRQGPNGQRQLSYTAPANQSCVLEVTGFDPQAYTTDAGRYVLRVQKVN